jgi:hypothetical protein
MPRTVRRHRLRYRRRGAALDRLNRLDDRLETWLKVKYSRLPAHRSKVPALRRLVLALIVVLCISLLVLAIVLLATPQRKPTDNHIWNNDVIQKRSRAKPLPDIKKRPERRYINEQL